MLKNNNVVCDVFLLIPIMKLSFTNLECNKKKRKEKKKKKEKRNEKEKDQISEYLQSFVLKLKF